MDLHLFAEGRHERLWEVLGAHPRSFTTPDGVVDGVSFAVWAPNAKGVSLIGEFNGWDGNEAPMRVLGSTGVWELFWPGFPTDGLYKFRVHGADGVGYRPRRPDGLRHRGAAAHRVAGDARATTPGTTTTGWPSAPQRNPVFEPMSTYEVHLGLVATRPELPPARRRADRITLWSRASPTSSCCRSPSIPFGGSWGYQVTSYYAPTSRFGTPDDFRCLVDALHQAGIGVIVDWVPGALPQGRLGAGPLRRHPALRALRPQSRRATRLGHLRFRLRPAPRCATSWWPTRCTGSQEFHIDGLRVDAVASMLYLDYSRPEGGWTPNIYGGRENLEAVQFLQEMNATVHKAAPGIVTIAEESTSWPGVTRPTNLGGLGFSMKWNMGWMHDTLDYISRDPIYRSYHHHEMTFSMLYAFSENYVLPISHDEVVHGKGTLWGRMPGNDHVKAAGLRSLLAYQWAHPGKQLLFMGQEFGQRAEWSEERGLDWWQLDEQGFSNGVQRLVRDINGIYRSHRGAVEPGHHARGLFLDRRQRLRQQRAELPALRQRRLGDGLRVQLLRRRAQRLPARPAARGPLARGAQHRRDHLQRRRASATRRRRRHRRPVARPPGVGGAGAAAHVGAVARARVARPAQVRVGISTARWRGCAGRR